MEQPVIVLCTKLRLNVPQRIEEFYTSESGRRRWDRLASCPLWIYPDLIFIFTDWYSTWKAARRNLAERSKVNTTPQAQKICTLMWFSGALRKQTLDARSRADSRVA